MSEKKKFTVYIGSVVLCVGVAVLLHYVSFTNPYLQSICHLLRPFIYIGLYLVWAISFQKRIIQKEPRRCLIMIAVMMVFWMLVRMCKFRMRCRQHCATPGIFIIFLCCYSLRSVFIWHFIYGSRKIINYRKDGVCCFFRHCF
mgnify:CR=1 FL=1